MNRTLRLVLCGLLLASVPLHAALEIVQTKDGDAPVYVLKNTSTGKVLGTFWDAATQKSDFGYSGDNGPGSFLWSEDRSYVAVNGAESGRYIYVSLFRAVDDTLKSIPTPDLPPGSTDAQWEAVQKAGQLAMESTTAVRWQGNGTLLLNFSAATHETDDTPQVEASLWADVKFEGDTATLVATSLHEPSAASSVEAMNSASQK